MRSIVLLAVLASLFLPNIAFATDKVQVYLGDAVGCESADASLKAKPTMPLTDIQAMDCLLVKDGTVLLVVARPESSASVVRVLRLNGSNAETFWISIAHLRPAH